MSSSTRLTTPSEHSPGPEVDPDMPPNDPATPDASLRNRGEKSPGPETTPRAQDNSSPTSSTASTSSIPRVFDSRSTLRGVYSSTSISSLNFPPVPPKKIIIRADPALVTCFDPADKELYDLWAPKH